eukprot:COSAG01_NODE_21183_length_914_cov_0.970552_1_plen_31_part_10
MVQRLGSQKPKIWGFRFDSGYLDQSDSRVNS